MQVWRLVGCMALTGVACFESPCEAPGQPGVIVACQPDDAGLVVGLDAGARDAGSGDAGRADAGRRDAGRPDGGPHDAGRVVGDGGLRVVDLGTRSVAMDASTGPLTFEVVPGDESFQIEVQTDDRRSILHIAPVANPLGTVMSTVGFESLSSHLSRSLPSQGNAAALVLESDDAARHWVPGRWSFSVANLVSQSPLRVSARVIIKEAPPATPARTLRANFCFTGSAGLTAAVARTDARLANAFNFSAGLFANAGVALTRGEFLDLPAGLSAVSLDADAGMLATMADVLAACRPRSEGVNIVWVESIGSLLGPVSGVSSGLPGLTMATGEGQAGVLVAYDSRVFTPTVDTPEDDLGVVLSHELGHQLGLSHVLEFLLRVEDNLSDTPGRDNDSAARGNLMYPSLTSGVSNAQVYVTPMQYATMRRNPVVRP